MGRMAQKIDETNKLASAAKATAEVVAEKFDETDEKLEKMPELTSSRIDNASLVTSIELTVLKRMVESRFVTRSVSGVSKDASLSKDIVQTTYGSLIAKGMVEQVTNADGKSRWRVTSLGRIVANEA